MTPTPQIQSLKTESVSGGIALSLELARDISGRLANKPSGTNYGEPALVPVEMIASIILVAVSIANKGWKSSPQIG